MNLPGIIFQTESGNVYAYNTTTNQIITVDRDWYDCISDDQRDKKVFEVMSGQGIIVGEIPAHIDWPLDKLQYLKAIEEAIPSLILEITQECTLRCQYCVYSGNYKNTRTHGNAYMNMEMIRRCIDYYAEHSRKLDTAQISFYGGEALIRFDLIKTAVEYANQVFNGKSLTFRISSNGTTLTAPVLKWLEENDNITVTVTINGMVHDKYRKFPSGEGSLWVIDAILSQIRENYPKVWERMEFIANVATLQELLDVRAYYAERIGKPPLLITGILEYGGNETIQEIVNEKDLETVVEEVRHLLYDQMDEYILPYYRTDLSDVANRLIGRRGERCIETASCMPFTSSLFISATGEFGVCERAGTCGRLGNIYEGINTDYVQNLLDYISNILNTRCKRCWCQRLCSMCIKDILMKESGELHLPEDFCVGMRKNMQANLRMFCEMAKRNPRAVASFQKNTSNSAQEKKNF